MSLFLGVEASLGRRARAIFPAPADGLTSLALGHCCSMHGRIFLVYSLNVYCAVDFWISRWDIGHAYKYFAQDCVELMLRHWGSLEAEKSKRKVFLFRKQEFLWASDSLHTPCFSRPKQKGPTSSFCLEPCSLGLNNGRVSVLGGAPLSFQHFEFFCVSWSCFFL